MEKIYNRFFSPHLPFRLALFNIISAVGLIGGLLSLCVSLANGLPPAQNIIVASAILVLMACMYGANYKGRLRLSSILIIILITLILLPLMFFTGGGVYGGMPSWFVIGMVFTFLLIEGKLCYVLLGIQAALYIACYCAAYYHPAWINRFPSESGVFIDIAQSMFAAAFTIGLIIRFQGIAYEKALRKSEEQNRQLEEATAAAVKANHAKTAFLSHMSHDIRTPINGIIGMLDIAERSTEDPARQADCLRKIRISAMHLNSLINDILDISMLESGRVEFSEEAFDMKELLENCLTITQEKAAERGITMTLDTQGLTHRFLIGSPLHVRQIVINIIGNAVKYNKEHGSITITAAQEAYRDGIASVAFCISDTGIGMSGEYLTRLFEPFTQEKQDARTQFSGSGLGMAITRELVEQMHGTISVSSRPGEGTSFFVVLPFQTAPEQACPEPEAASGQADKKEVPSIAGTRILLVEDNELNREIAEYILLEAGATVISAADGEEAVGRFSSSAPGEYDCILMDIMMPVMDGFEATHRIRSMDRADAKTVPIIAMTANAYAEDVRKSKSAGMDEHLTKPLDNAKMVELIAKVTGKNGQAL